MEKEIRSQEIPQQLCTDTVGGLFEHVPEIYLLH
jgi:hypothetical protein